jgi:thioesterase domain-containing protein
MAGKAKRAKRIPNLELFVELFTAKHGTMAWNSGLDRGWLRYANAGLIAKEVSGDHYTFLRRPNVYKLAEHLADSLQGIQ